MPGGALLFHDFPAFVFPPVSGIHVPVGIFNCSGVGFAPIMLGDKF